MASIVRSTTFRSTTFFSRSAWTARPATNARVMSHSQATYVVGRGSFGEWTSLQISSARRRPRYSVVTVSFRAVNTLPKSHMDISVFESRIRKGVMSRMRDFGLNPQKICVRPPGPACRGVRPRAPGSLRSLRLPLVFTQRRAAGRRSDAAAGPQQRNRRDDVGRLRRLSQVDLKVAARGLRDRVSGG